MSALERIKKAQASITVPPENVVIKRADLDLLIAVFTAAETMPDYIGSKMNDYEDDFINLHLAVGNLTT